jgi:putative flippase GtrA
VRQHWRSALRLARFAIVGLTCFAIQAAILTALHELGIPLTLSNAIGFIASAQINFLLSTWFTWSDRRVPFSDVKTTATRWASFQTTAGIALCFNTAVFAIAARLLDPVVAAAVGVAAGAALTFAVNHFLIFRHTSTDRPAPESTGGHRDHPRSTPDLPGVGAAQGTAAD